MSDLATWSRSNPHLAAMQIEQLEAQLKAAREALAFYRDGFTYAPKRTSLGIDTSTWKPKEELLDDCGELARSILDPATTGAKTP